MFWAWLTVCIIFLTLGVITAVPELFLLALSALLTAIATKAGLTTLWQWQAMCFASMLLIFTVFLRNRLKILFKARGICPDYEGQKAIVVKDIPEGGTGRIRYRGTEWDAVSVKGEVIPVGTQVKIVRREGTKFFVEQTYESTVVGKITKALPGGKNDNP
jgi:membrane protein implicated in regulation of membrane protease activity